MPSTSNGSIRVTNYHSLLTVVSKELQEQDGLQMQKSLQILSVGTTAAAICLLKPMERHQKNAKPSKCSPA